MPGLQVTLLLRLATFVNEFVCLLHISSCRFSSHCSLYCFAVRIVANDVATVAVGVDAGVGAPLLWFDTQATPLPKESRSRRGAKGGAGSWSTFGYVPRWQCDAFKKQSILISI